MFISWISKAWKGLSPSSFNKANLTDQAMMNVMCDNLGLALRVTPVIFPVSVYFLNLTSVLTRNSLSFVNHNFRI